MYISPDYNKSILLEHRFWLQILGDHSRFILNALSPKEEEKINKTKYFIETFDTLLERSRQNLADRNLNQLNEVAFEQAKNLRMFKLDLLKDHLVGKIDINLPPTFINHMLNELDEYLNILKCIFNNQFPQAHPLHYHRLWLLDGVGHANSINSNLDDIEKDLKHKSKKFSKHFNELYMKSLEFIGYLRTKLAKFPALARLNRQAELEMSMFMNFLNELAELKSSKQALGTVTPLMIDHMYREECYYLTKLSQVSEVKKPECDPGKPRIEA